MPDENKAESKNQAALQSQPTGDFMARLQQWRNSLRVDELEELEDVFDGLRDQSEEQKIDLY
jgi:hypothetical protein